MKKHRSEKPAPLDGNAAAGLLSELFAIDITAAVITCGGCGTIARVGEVGVYGGAMGAVFRCASCDTVMMRLVRNQAGYWFEMQGVKKLAAKSAAN